MIRNQQLQALLGSVNGGPGGKPCLTPNVLIKASPGVLIAAGILQILDAITCGNLGLPPCMRSGGPCVFIPDCGDAGGDVPLGSCSGYCTSIENDSPPLPGGSDDTIVAPIDYTCDAGDPNAGSPLDTTSAPPSGSYDSVTPDEQKMFQEMYAGAGLDADTMQILSDGWTKSTSAKRKADYDSFMAQMPKVADAGGAAAVPDAPPPEHPQTDPVTADEQKMFQEMYGSRRTGCRHDAGPQ